MKIFKIIATVLIVLFVITLISAFIFIKTFDINKYRPQLIAQATKALGHPVNFDSIDLHLSLQQGARLNVKNFSIAESPSDKDIPQENLLSVDNVLLNLDIFSFLIKRQIIFSNIQVQSPHLVIVRQKDGLVNLATLGAPSSPPGSPTQQPVQHRASVTPPLPSIIIDSITLNEGRIKFVDRALEKPLTLEASQITLQINHFSFNDPFHSSLQGAIFSPKENLWIEGDIALNISEDEIKLNNFKVKTDVGQIPLEKLRSLIPLPENTPFPEELSGNLELVIKDGVVSSKGIKTLSLDTEIKDGHISFKEFAPGVSFSISHTDLKIDDFSLNQLFSFKLQTAYLSNSQNITVDGTALLGLTPLKLELKDTKFSSDLSVLMLDQMKSSIAALKDVPFPDLVAGKMEGRIKDLTVNDQGLSSMSIDAEVRGGKIQFKEISSGVSLNLSQIGLKVNDFSLSEPFSFSLQAAYLDSLPNILAEGVMSLNLEKQSVELSKTKISTDLASLSMLELKNSVKALQSISLPENMLGKLNLNLESLEAGAQGLSNFEGAVQLSDGSLTLKELISPLNNINAEIKADSKKLELSKLTFSAGKGTMNIDGRVNEFLTKQDLKANLDVQGVALDELLNQKDWPVKIAGKIYSKFTTQTQGLDPEKIKKNINGEGNFEIKEGRLIDINVLKTVLDKIAMIPNLAEKVQASLPDKYKQILTQKDTEITKAAFTTQISDGKAALSPVNIEFEGFEVYGKGNAASDNSFDFDGSFLISPDLSSSMVAGVPELQALFNDEQKISIPIHLIGNGANVKFSVDIKDLGTKIIKNEGKAQLEKVLDKVFKNNGASNPDNNNAPQPADNNQPETNQKPIERQIIENVIDRIFK